MSQLGSLVAEGCSGVLFGVQSYLKLFWYSYVFLSYDSTMDVDAGLNVLFYQVVYTDCYYILFSGSFTYFPCYHFGAFFVYVPV